MIQLKITMSNGAFVTRNCQTQQEADEYLAYIAINGNWGKGEHQEVDVPQHIIQHDAIPEVLYQAAKDAVLDANGVEIEPASPEVLAIAGVDAYEETVLATYKTILAEYTVEQTDITAQLNQEQVNKEAEEYLTSTDWYVLRMMDAGTPLPAGVQDLRQAARNRIVR